MGKLTIVGLGPGNADLLTLGAVKAMQETSCLLLRTGRHPTVAELERLGLSFLTYDEVYETESSFEAVYQTITVDVLRRAETADVVYAVPGSPVVAERTVQMLCEQAHAWNISVEVLPGMSFVEILCVRLGLDPINGLTILDAADLERVCCGALPTGLVVTQVYNRQVASDVKLTLMEHYGDVYPVELVNHLGLADESVRSIPLCELDRQQDMDHLTSIYVPSLQSRTEVQPFEVDALTEVMEVLRSPEGCVWDRQQDHRSLRRYLLEETYEVLEAIEKDDMELLCEELGDLLLQVVFHARIAEENGRFSMQEVIDGVVDKMVRRHPHVFGEITVDDAAEVVRNWERIKREEKNRGGVLAGVPREFPALLKACKLQGKAAKVGFDWPDVAPVWGKVDEELQELREAASEAAREDELGDVLFAMVNLARFLHVEPETALLKACLKFENRFGFIEKQLQEKGVSWEQSSLTELDALWNAAKALE